MKRGVIWLLLCGLLCGLWGCKKDPAKGIYYGVYVQTSDGMYLMEDYFNGENYLELEGGGDAVLNIHNTEHELSWKRDGDVLYFTESGDAFEGSLNNGVIVLDYLNWGMVLTFVKDGATVPTLTQDREDSAEWAETVTLMQEFWNGEWYGWWYISDGMGDYAASTGSWWDCAAVIEIGDDARGSITVWDETHPKTEPLSECVLRIYEEGSMGTMGIAMSGQGSFMGEPVYAGDWLIDPSIAPYEDLLEINGYFDGGKGDGFFYTLFLRPWGQSWEDVAQAKNPNVLPDVLPKHYDWYMGALEKGESLPDRIG